jgi:hypothetical protein
VMNLIGNSSNQPWLTILPSDISRTSYHPTLTEAVKRGLQNSRLYVSLAAASTLLPEFWSYAASRGFGISLPTYSLACSTPISSIHRTGSLCPKAHIFRSKIYMALSIPAADFI